MYNMSTFFNSPLLHKRIIYVVLLQQYLCMHFNQCFQAHKLRLFEEGKIYMPFSCQYLLYYTLMCPHTYH